MAAMISRDSCVFEVSLECVNKEVYLYAPTEFNVIYNFPDHALQVMYCWTKAEVNFTVDRVCSLHTFIQYAVLYLMC